MMVITLYIGDTESLDCEWLGRGEDYFLGR